MKELIPNLNFRVVSHIVPAILLLLFSELPAQSSQVSDTVSGQQWMQQGEQWFEKRNEGASGKWASPTPVQNAINAFEKASKTPELHSIAMEKLLEARWFYGAYVLKESLAKKNWFRESYKIAENMRILYPRQEGFAYWYSVHMGLWANEVGFVKLVYKGVAGKIHDAIHSVEKKNPDYAGGGTYFMLGSLYHITPKIPFYTGWATNTKAEEYIRKGLKKEPGSFAGKYFLALIFKDTGREKEAEDILQKLLKTAPRSSKRVEDEEIKTRSRELLKS
jgi:tetratricopeptide (TPR) repeat protein